MSQMCDKKENVALATLKRQLVERQENLRTYRQILKSQYRALEFCQLEIQRIRMKHDRTLADERGLTAAIAILEEAAKNE